jgi:hypothetical protein
VNVLSDAVERRGMVVCPASSWEIQDYARDNGCRVAVFTTEQHVNRRDAKLARATGVIRGDRILVDGFGDDEDAGPVDPALPAAPQVAAALAAAALRSEAAR